MTDPMLIRMKISIGMQMKTMICTSTQWMYVLT